MKKIALLTLCISLSLTSCLNIIEEIMLAGTGGGTYQATMDMSGMMEFIDMMAAMDTSATKEAEKIKEASMDSTFSFKSYADTAASLTADQRRLYAGATGRLQMSGKDKKMLITLNFPFEKLDDLGVLSTITTPSKSLGALGGGDAGSMLGGAGGDLPIPSFSDVYDMVYSAGLTERRLNETKLNAFKQSKTYQEMSQGGDALLSGMTLKTVINLPTAAKEVKGPKAVLSADRKKMTIEGTMGDMFENPASLAYRVTY